MGVCSEETMVWTIASRLVWTIGFFNMKTAMIFAGDSLDYCFGDCMSGLGAIRSELLARNYCHYFRAGV